MSEVKAVITIAEQEYGILEQVATGTEGRVYRGRDTEGLVVAVKELHEVKPQHQADIEKKLALWYQLHDVESVPSLHCSGRNSNGLQHFYVVADWIEGRNLAEVRAQRHYTEKDGVELLVDALHGIDPLHQRGLIHRDISPRNIMITPKGKLMYTDLGSIRSMITDLYGASIMASRAVATLGYMAPETQAGNDPKAPADLYSIGGVLWYVLTGEDPKAPRHRRLGEQGLDFALLEERDISPKLARVVKKLRAEDVTQRYQNVAEVLADLEVEGLLEDTSDGPTDGSIDRQLPEERGDSVLADGADAFVSVGTDFGASRESRASYASLVARKEKLEHDIEGFLIPQRQGLTWRQSELPGYKEELRQVTAQLEAFPTKEELETRKVQLRRGLQGVLSAGIRGSSYGGRYLADLTREIEDIDALLGAYEQQEVAVVSPHVALERRYLLELLDELNQQKPFSSAESNVRSNLDIPRSNVEHRQGPIAAHDPRVHFMDLEGMMHTDASSGKGLGLVTGVALYLASVFWHPAFPEISNSIAALVAIGSGVIGAGVGGLAHRDVNRIRNRVYKPLLAAQEARRNALEGFGLEASGYTLQYENGEEIWSRNDSPTEVSYSFRDNRPNMNAVRQDDSDRITREFLQWKLDNNIPALQEAYLAERRHIYSDTEHGIFAVPADASQEQFIAAETASLEWLVGHPGGDPNERKREVEEYAHKYAERVVVGKRMGGYDRLVFFDPLYGAATAAMIGIYPHHLLTMSGHEKISNAAFAAWMVLGAFLGYKNQRRYRQRIARQQQFEETQRLLLDGFVYKADGCKLEIRGGKYIFETATERLLFYGNNLSPTGIDCRDPDRTDEQRTQSFLEWQLRNELPQKKAVYVIERQETITLPTERTLTDRLYDLLPAIIQNRDHPARRLLRMGRSNNSVDTVVEEPIDPEDSRLLYAIAAATSLVSTVPGWWIYSYTGNIDIAIGGVVVVTSVMTAAAFSWEKNIGLKEIPSRIYKAASAPFKELYRKLEASKYAIVPGASASAGLLSLSEYLQFDSVSVGTALFGAAIGGAGGAILGTFGKYFNNSQTGSRNRKQVQDTRETLDAKVTQMRGERDDGLQPVERMAQQFEE
jgi:serine/threonine protein kinase